MSVFGIDLGTTYSCIAKYNPEINKPEAISDNATSRTLTPSVIYFEPDSEKIIVGKTAIEALSQDPSRGIRLIKRSMGRDDELLTIGSNGYNAHELSAFILRYLKEYVENQTGETVEDVVITVPAYFGYPERQATEKAGIAAGLNVRALIEEPTAAALSYFAEYKGSDPINVFVYDLGGGTFDISALTMTVHEDGRKYARVLKTDGNHQLGGANWDSLLSELAKRKFTETYPDEQLDPDTEERIFIQTEEKKKSLTAKDKAVFRLGHEKNVEVTREEFESETKTLLAMTEALCESVRNSDELSGIKFDKVLLTGGSSNMPAVHEMIEKVFPGCEILMADFNEAVAKGAAIACHLIECSLWPSVGPEPPVGPELPEMFYAPRVPKALGFRVRDEQGNLIINVRFFKGEELDNKTHSLTKIITDYRTTRDNMDSVKVAVFELVYENTANPDVPVEWADNEHKEVAGVNSFQIRYLGELKMPLEPNQPARTPLTLIVTVSESGIRMECFNASVPDSKHYDCTIPLVSDIDPEKIGGYTVDSE